MPQRKKCKVGNKIAAVLLILIVILLIVYLFVPFLNNGFLKKTFSPFCGIKKMYQGEEYLPAWCLMDEDSDEQAVNENTNSNKSDDDETDNSVGLANPAAVKCVKDGGSLESYQTEAGEAGLCVFADKSICNQWDYFRGDCDSGECMKECQSVGTKNEGWYNSCNGQRIELDKCGEEDEEEEADSDEVVEDDEPVQKNIKITSPLADQQLSSPFTVEGQSIAKDNKIYVRVKNTVGSVLIEETTTATSQSGSQWADFDIDLSYEFDLTKEGSVEVYSLDENDNEINLITIPVKF